jgi:hypothetical protein
MRAHWVREIALPQMAKALSVSAGQAVTVYAVGYGLGRRWWSVPRGGPAWITCWLRRSGCSRWRMRPLVRPCRCWSCWLPGWRLAPAPGCHGLRRRGAGALGTVVGSASLATAFGVPLGTFVAGVAGWRVAPDTGPQHQRSVLGRRQYRTHRTGASSTPHNGAQTALICAHTRRHVTHVNTDQRRILARQVAGMVVAV